MNEACRDYVLERVKTLALSDAARDLAMARYRYRPYHGWNHLAYLYGKLKPDIARDIAVLFHDFYSVCDRDAPNEDDGCVDLSIAAMETFCPDEYRMKASACIEVTKYRSIPQTEEEKEMKWADWEGFFEFLEHYQQSSKNLMLEAVIAGMGVDDFIRLRLEFLENLSNVPHIAEMVRHHGEESTIASNVNWEKDWLYAIKRGGESPARPGCEHA